MLLHASLHAHQLAGRIRPAGQWLRLLLGLQTGASKSTVISFAQKTLVQGTLTSKLHVIELGAAAGRPLHPCMSCLMLAVLTQDISAWLHVQS